MFTAYTYVHFTWCGYVVAALTVIALDIKEVIPKLQKIFYFNENLTNSFVMVMKITQRIKEELIK